MHDSPPLLPLVERPAMLNATGRPAACKGAALTAMLAVLPGLAAAQAPAQPSAAVPYRVPDTTAQRVQACTTCHGKEGRATNQGYFPRIAGKPAGYLYNQLAPPSHHFND
jgi:cytochrome c553